MTDILYESMGPNRFYTPPAAKPITTVALHLESQKAWKKTFGCRGDAVLWLTVSGFSPYKKYAIGMIGDDLVKDRIEELWLKEN